MKTLQELKPLILNWAKEKNILNKENVPAQKLKLLEEVGETASAILKNKTDEIKDGLGDIYVVLIIMAGQSGEDFDLGESNRFWEEAEIYELLSTIIYYDIFVDFSAILELCKRLSLDMTECANLAWDEIKNRTGKTVNGTFIKN